MLKINVIAVGTLKEKYLKEAENEYLKRLSKYAKMEMIEVNESRIDSFTNEALMNKTMEAEALNLLKRIKSNDYVVLVDLHGEELDSIELAYKLDKIISSGSGVIDFIIGGTLGLGEAIRNRANTKLCLSKLTFPHQLTRIIILEQIYRCFKINNNESYHH